MTTHLIHQRDVDALEIVILGALHKECVERVVSGEEGVGVVRRGVLPHLGLETAELSQIVVGQIGQSEPDGQVFERLAHSIGIEKLARGERADEGALSRFEGNQPVGGELVQRFPHGNPADIELAGQSFLGKRGVGRKGVAQDLLAQMLIDLFGQRGVVQDLQVWRETVLSVMRGWLHTISQRIGERRSRPMPTTTAVLYTIYQERRGAENACQLDARMAV